MVTKLMGSYCGAHLVESYCKESNISEDTNWSQLIKICLRVRCQLLANWHILKTWISLERKKIFENWHWHWHWHMTFLSSEFPIIWVWTVTDIHVHVEAGQQLHVLCTFWRNKFYIIMYFRRKLKSSFLFHLNSIDKC